MAKTVYPISVAEVSSDTNKGKAFAALSLIVYETADEMVADGNAGLLQIGQACMAQDTDTINDVYLYRFLGVGLGFIRTTYEMWAP